MSHFLTLGETMVSLVPQGDESIAYGPSLKMRIAGAESNTAIGIKKLGSTATFISAIGDDSIGDYLLRMLRAEGLDTTYIDINKEHRTGIMFKDPLPSDTFVYYYRERSAASQMKPELLSDSAFKNADIFHFTGITPILSDDCEATIRKDIALAQDNQCLISFDPNIRAKLWKNIDYTPLMKELAAQSDYLLLGLSEAERLYGTTDIKELTRLILQSKKIKAFAIKNGKEGAWVIDSTQCHFIPPHPVVSIDSVGAGDAFNAGFLTGVLANKDLYTCGLMGAINGAFATQTKGDIEGLLSTEELHHILNQTAPCHR